MYALPREFNWKQQLRLAKPLQIWGSSIQRILRLARLHKGKKQDVKTSAIQGCNNSAWILVWGKGDDRIVPFFEKKRRPSLNKPQTS